MCDNNPLVTIIVPNYNCGKFIQETIKSIKNQTYINWELIFIDDASTDNSLEIIRSFQINDDRMRIYINNEQKGAAYSRNLAIQYSLGGYLAFLDSDDVWVSTKLEDQLKFMFENHADFSFTCYEHIDENSDRLGLKAKVVNKLSYHQMMLHCWPGCLTVMYKQDLNNKIYGPDIKKNNDHALFLKVLKQTKRAMGFDKCLAYYRIRKNSISSKKLDIIKYYIKVIHFYEQKNIFFALFCVFTHVVIKCMYKYKRVD